MDELTAFLRTIADEPDDDAHRLVFADWLTDHGHESRAEFIRLQVELARLDPSADGYAAKVAKMRRTGVFTTPGAVPYFDHVPGDECRVAFRRGMIEVVHAGDGSLAGAGPDLLPLRSLRTGTAEIESFRRFAKLRQLELWCRDVSPERLLEIFGPGGWFPELEELRLTNRIERECLEAGVIPRFDLPRLRRFCLASAAFYQLGRPDVGVERDDDYYSNPRPWDGFPERLTRNAVPGPASPLERFVWHSEDDRDYFSDEGWYWRGPTMEALFGCLEGRALKQVEVAVDYDDHERGREGVIAAPYAGGPLALSPMLEAITMAPDDLGRLTGPPGRLKALRVYGGASFGRELRDALARPVCSGLESLHLESRGGWDSSGRDGRPRGTFTALKSLSLSGIPLDALSECEFPNLLSLSNVHPPSSVLARSWPTLQHLAVYVYDADELAALAELAGSDRCPNLITLTVGRHYGSEPDFSFLAKCPHMPHLSLVRLADSSAPEEYIVDRGRLLRVREDVMAEESPPPDQFRLSAVF